MLIFENNPSLMKKLLITKINTNTFQLMSMNILSITITKCLILHKALIT